MFFFFKFLFFSRDFEEPPGSEHNQRVRYAVINSYPADRRMELQIPYDRLFSNALHNYRHKRDTPKAMYAYDEIFYLFKFLADELWFFYSLDYEGENKRLSGRCRRSRKKFLIFSDHVFSEDNSFSPQFQNFLDLHAASFGVTPSILRLITRVCDYDVFLI